MNVETLKTPSLFLTKPTYRTTTPNSTLTTPIHHKPAIAPRHQTHPTPNLNVYSVDTITVTMLKNDL